MPASVYGLIATFAAISVVSGLVAARLVGPWRWWSPILPMLAAFGALYLIAHRWVVSIGPQVSVFGWEIALPFDTLVALATAAAVAAVQRGAASLLQAQ